MSRALRVAIIGSGPAGIYAADALTKSDADVSVDIIERDPAPYGLIRYGVAPDHPRIKEIVKALHRTLQQPAIRFLGNVEYGTDLKLDDLRQFYDAVVIATGARYDRPLDVPGVELPGSHGAADFVSWYDGHPDVPREWPLTAESVAVLGAGNVALDVARVLSKSAEELSSTEIPDNVHSGIAANQANDVHVFARRGPAQVKFTPMELRELGQSPSFDVIVHPEGFELDEASLEAIRTSKSVKLVVDRLQNYVATEPTGKPRRLHIHFCEAPVEILGDAEGVTGLRTERTELSGDASARGTGEYTDWDVQAVYRAIGYLSTPLPDVPFDCAAGVVPNDGGRVLGLDGEAVASTYVTGWIKRGPVGLIGHTKGDAAQTVAMLLEDAERLAPAEHPDPAAITAHLEDRQIAYTTWRDWQRLDAHEIALGEAEGRQRKKVVPREDMVRIARG